MRFFSCKAVVLIAALGLAVGSANVYAASKHPAQQKAPAGQKLSLLGGKLVFRLPKEYVKNPMPEIDAKARAAGVSGALYLNTPAKRVVIVTEAPLESGLKASSNNDPVTLDGLIGATLEQQRASYKDFKPLGEKQLVRRGLGIRQLDVAGSMDGAKVLSSTVTAASGKRMVMVNVISLEKDAAAHAALLKVITDNRK